LKPSFALYEPNESKQENSKVAEDFPELEQMTEF
jgi:hypothetical protein